jgi:hypothetical protein
MAKGKAKAKKANSKKKTQATAKNQLLKGSALAAHARKKASNLGLDGKGMKLVDLVWMVQEKEGHTSCFKKQKECDQGGCCWQLSCGASMG